MKDLDAQKTLEIGLVISIVPAEKLVERIKKTAPEGKDKHSCMAYGKCKTEISANGANKTTTQQDMVSDVWSFYYFLDCLTAFIRNFTFPHQRTEEAYFV